MKLEKIRDSYYTNTRNASTVSRQASFAGIALIWIFKTQDNEALILPNELLWPTLFFILSLTFDLLQYISGSAIWGKLNRIKELKYGTDYEDDIAISKYVNWPAIFFFWAKLIFVLIAYLSVFKYVIENIKFVT